MSIRLHCRNLALEVRFGLLGAAPRPGMHFSRPPGGARRHFLESYQLLAPPDATAPRIIGPETWFAQAPRY